MTDPWSAEDDDLFEEVVVTRTNGYLRALWSIGVISLVIAVMGLGAAQSLFGPMGFSFDGSSVPLSYYIASVASSVSPPLLTGGLVCIGLALGVSAITTHLTRLPEVQDDRIAPLRGKEEFSASPPVSASQAVEPVPPLDPRVFMRPSAAERTGREAGPA